jgi:hypothetical protein
MMLVAGVAGTFVLGSAGVALASTHDSPTTNVSALQAVESSTSVGETTSVEDSTTSVEETSTSTDEEPTTSADDESSTTETPTTNEATSTTTEQSPTLETKTYATIGGTVVVQIDADGRRVQLVSATPADGWTVKSHNPNPRGHGFVDVRFRQLTGDLTTASASDVSGGHKGKGNGFTGTEVRVRVGFAAWRLIEFVSTRTVGPAEQPPTSTTTGTSTSVEDDDHGRGRGQDDSDENDDRRGRGNDDPPNHDQGDDHGGRGQSGDDHGGNRGGGNGGGDDNSNRGGNGGGGDDHGGRHG